jgi:hypothetical protein
MDSVADAGHVEAPPPSPRTLATSSPDPAVVISRLESELRSEQNKTKMLRAELKQAREQQIATVREMDLKIFCVLFFGWISRSATRGLQLMI